jgi:peptidoglycan/xylan/chitin deacetylase (PgdA/CDA1 family)|tara:strand:+ start:594 stop:1202 length:609 start_codon:yes stop_codon:yes gene_type:complete
VFVKTPKIVQHVFPSIIWKKKTTKKKIWLTFDDGPDKKITVFLLNLLKKLKIHATFFLIGEQIVKYPELTKKIIEDGHVIGNHSYSHLNGLLTSNKTYYNDIDRAQKIVNSNIFRPPYGKISPIQLRTLKVKYKIIMWDVLSWDFKKNISSEKIYNNVINNTQKGSIIVFHNNIKSYQTITENLEKILVKLKEEGYRFSTIW